MSSKKLVRAAMSGNIQGVKDALKTQVSQEAKDIALYHATFESIIRQTEEPYLEIIDILVRAGASPNYVNDESTLSSIIFASFKANENILRILLKANNIDINQRINGKAPLDYLIIEITRHGLFQEQKDINLIHLLLDAGADPYSALIIAKKPQYKSSITPKIIEVLEHKIKKNTHEGRLETGLGFGSFLPANVVSKIGNIKNGPAPTPVATNTYNIKTRKPIYETHDPIRKINTALGKKLTQGGKRKTRKHKTKRRYHSI